MLKVWSIMYRIVLVVSVVLQFGANLFISGWEDAIQNKPTDYVIVAFIVITIIALTVYANAQRRTVKQFAKYLAMALVLQGAIAVAFMLIIMLTHGGFIPVLIIGELLFILLSLAVCRGLWREA